MASAETPVITPGHGSERMSAVAARRGRHGRGLSRPRHELGRDVALKILPEAFIADPERLARFEREAQLLAALNHPNIGAIYGLDESDGAQFLVLELVEGETLAERWKRGPMPQLDEASRSRGRSSTRSRPRTTRASSIAT